MIIGAFDGMLHVLRVGCPWRDMRERYQLAIAVRRLGGVRAIAAPAITADFFEALDVQEQAAWVNDLAQRTTFPTGADTG